MYTTGSVSCRTERGCIGSRPEARDCEIKESQFLRELDQAGEATDGGCALREGHGGRKLEDRDRCTYFKVERQVMGIFRGAA